MADEIRRHRPRLGMARIAVFSAFRYAFRPAVFAGPRGVQILAEA